MKRAVIAVLAWTALAWTALPSATALAGSSPSALMDSDPAQAAIRQADARKLEGCLSRSSKADTCILLISAPCEKRARDNHGSAACHRREAEAWSTLVDRYRDKAAAYLSGEREKLEALDGAQKAWLDHRERTCAFGYTFIDGSMGVPLAAACEVRETARRAIYLRTLLDYANLLD
jgi:uncharacterized protein YecT (DUF1311 family)